MRLPWNLQGNSIELLRNFPNWSESELNLFISNTNSTGIYKLGDSLKIGEGVRLQIHLK